MAPPEFSYMVQIYQINLRLNSAIFRSFFRCPSPGRGLMGLFFGLFCYFSIFFPLAPPPLEIFLPTPLHRYFTMVQRREGAWQNASLNTLLYTIPDPKPVFPECIWTSSNPCPISSESQRGVQIRSGSRFRLHFETERNATH